MENAIEIVVPIVDQSSGFQMTRKIYEPFNEVVDRVTNKLKEEGFGIITQMNVKEIMKEKLGIDFRNYKILGACNPVLAHKALEAQDKIGVMLPCNVVIQEQSPGHVEISTIDTVGVMKATNDPNLLEVANEVRERLLRVLQNL